jgi:hypothetical protein
VLKKEYLSCRRELNATSSQDEFAKWAKLRRTHDKLLERLEKKSTGIPHVTRIPTAQTILILPN